MHLNEIQKQMIQQLDRVSQFTEGLAGVAWQPGEGCTFDEPIRYASEETRPVATILETTANSGLTLSIATARPYNGRLVFVTHGKWDFRAPIIPGGQREQLNLNKPKHRLNLRRGIEALHEILNYGFACKRGESPELAKPVWPIVMQLENGRFVEDYTPVLGAQDKNTLAAVREIAVRLPNPAAKILARRGLESAEQAEKDPQLFDELAAEIRATAPDMELTETAVCEALLNPEAPVLLSVDIKTAAAKMPLSTADQLRQRVSRRAANEATDQELLIAAANPDQPLVMNRLSKVQVCDIADWQDLPAPYAGSILAPVVWSPRTKFAVIDEVASEVEA